MGGTQKQGEEEEMLGKKQEYLENRIHRELSLAKKHGTHNKRGRLRPAAGAGSHLLPPALALGTGWSGHCACPHPLLHLPWAARCAPRAFLGTGAAPQRWGCRELDGRGTKMNSICRQYLKTQNKLKIFMMNKLSIF